MGGTTSTGGSSTIGASTVGGSSFTGGRSSATSTSGAGGSSVGAGGTTAAAGSTAIGGATSSSTSTTRVVDAGTGDGGVVSSGYCEGDKPKLTVQGQTISPGVTDFEANVAMDCCNGYGVNLHSTATLGFDVAVELIVSMNATTPREYPVGSKAAMRPSARVFKTSDPPVYSTAGNSEGRMSVFGVDGSASYAEFGLCLEVTDTASSLYGAQLYVPKVSLGTYKSDDRFQIFLLKDPSLRSDAVSALPMDSLVLASYPVLDLRRIAYVEKATTKIGFNPGQKIGESLRTQLGSTLGTPFVAVADGVRIYVGTFTSGVSSLGPVGPFVYVEDITADSLTLKAPTRGSDPRNDDRILTALGERGKLVP
jgi:hypothetical protein